ncbi:choice-of-anchor Q domain-containing protein, partial [Lutimaribacter marinistellae]
MTRFVVNTLGEDNDPNNRTLSLREAIALANGSSFRDEIVFSNSLKGDTITLTQGELTISDSVSINGDVSGDGRADITISGNNSSRLFWIDGRSISVELESLTLRDGSATGFGGAIVHRTAGSSLALVNSTIRDSAASTEGGAIFSAGNLSLINSTLHDNSAIGDGGAVLQSGGSLTTVNTTLYFNASRDDGGALALRNTSANLYSSTISTNYADVDGSNGNKGGGIHETGSTLNVYNSALEENRSGGTMNSFAGRIDELWGSFVYSAQPFPSIFSTLDLGNVVGSVVGPNDAFLGYLFDNGGPVPTQAVYRGSPLAGLGILSKLPFDTFDLDGDGNVGERLPIDANGLPRLADTRLDAGAVQRLDVVTVSTIVDEFDADRSAGDLSLREAVSMVADGGTIRFDESLDGQTIALNSQIRITKEMTIQGDIDGDTNPDVTITNAGANRHFEIDISPGQDVELNGLRMLGGGSLVPGHGGSIRMDSIGGELVLRNMEFEGNDAQGDGGAVSVVLGALSILESRFHDNHADRGGAISLGILSPPNEDPNLDQRLTIFNSSFTSNYAADEAGAIKANESTSLIANTTIADNTARTYGGGLFFVGFDLPRTEIINSTITGNIAYQGDGTSGSGINAIGGDVRIYNSVVAQNQSPDTDAPENLSGGGFTRVVHSFVGPSDAGLGTIPTTGSTLNAGDPGLGPLVDGHRDILPGSPLISAGRGIYRPTDVFDLDEDGGTDDLLFLDARLLDIVNSTDIGAVNYQDLMLVDSTGDGIDGRYGPGQLTLREAVHLVEEGGIIQFDFSIRDQTITLTDGPIVLDKDLSIDNGRDVTISGGGTNQIFDISGADTDVHLRGVILANGAADRGGAIDLAGNAHLTLENAFLQGNQATQAGGAIHSAGNLRIINSTFQGNTTDGLGGGIFQTGAQMQMINGTLLENESGLTGGGLAFSNADVEVSSSTIIRNKAGVGQTAQNYGGGIYSGPGTLTITNSVVAENTSGLSNTPDDMRGAADFARFSFFGTQETLSNNLASINGGGDPGLGELIETPTRISTTRPPTVQPLEGSPLIGAGFDLLLPNDDLDLDFDRLNPDPLPVDATGGRRVLQTLDIGAAERRTLTVDTPVDELDDDFSPGDLSLREAVRLLSGGPSEGRITFDPSLSGQTLVLSGGEITIGGTRIIVDGDIDGDRAADITLDADGRSRHFTTGLDGSLEIRSLTLTGGNNGSLYSDFNSITVIDSTITGNSSPGSGGAIQVGRFSELTVLNSLISNNSAAVNGGGIFVPLDGNATVKIINSTITGNTAVGRDGGGIYMGRVDDGIEITSSTISGNTAGGFGGGLAFGGTGADGAIREVSNSVIAGNAAGVSATANVSGGLNALAASFLSGDPRLGPLQDNGGPVQTMLPQAGSPLIDAGDDSLLPEDALDLDGDGNRIEPLPFDARGAERRQGPPDIGAVEVGRAAKFSETGSFLLSSDAVTVSLQRSYVAPVVVAFVSTENGFQPVN